LRGGHAERPEDAFGQDFAQRLVGQPFDDAAEQQKVAVAVEEAAARREVEMAIALRLAMGTWPALKPSGSSL
jgi:hypothetical protein